MAITALIKKVDHFILTYDHPGDLVADLVYRAIEAAQVGPLLKKILFHQFLVL